jgi:hypothetical protein
VPALHTPRSTPYDARVDDETRWFFIELGRLWGGTGASVPAVHTPRSTRHAPRCTMRAPILTRRGCGADESAMDSVPPRSCFYLTSLSASLHPISIPRRVFPSPPCVLLRSPSFCLVLPFLILRMSYPHPSFYSLPLTYSRFESFPIPRIAN